MIKILDNINITSILEELSLVQEVEWNDTRAWTNPVNEPPVESIRDQDRLHLIWQLDPDGGNQHWWKNPDYVNDPPMITPYGKKFSNTISLLENYCSSKKKKIYRVFLSRLQPGAQVYPHTDKQWGKNFDINSRYGIVLTTNPDCKVIWQDTTANPDVGSLFWFDNTKTHGAINNGSTSRIYLYMDIMDIVAELT
jgi:hypothetical protein